ncbi:hypothetical protein FGKAn22_08220 [Ferrigenium kumadai]|uniref:Circularly permuted type 2 ATP-grasp protein n=1 Tax=Ferrigenium kumadai TaxID=1682490 RepID=A0AAN1T0L0_9PROT|nr:hypothetical protein [Ferrigenium kumadai]BBI99129.1 hypothetical protein FGKAn22_08220 [Ferrigenium kumadai]
MVDAANAKPHFDVDHAPIAHLNGECHDWAGMDGDALVQALRAQGEEWCGMVAERCPHLFAAMPVFVTSAQVQQMHAIIAAVERVVALPGWHEGRSAARGVFYGYDFHLNEQGAHLIEINTNAGGGFLNALLIDSQREAGLYGEAAAEANLEQQFLAMFRNEWRLAHGDVPLKSVAIVDEQPESQYLYPEFLLAQRMFERAGIAAYIADPSALQARDGGLYLGEQKIDLVYNRLTDFSLQRHPALRQVYLDGSAVVTPDPAHYEHYADKRNLARLSDADALRALGASEADIATLLAGVPQTRLVAGADHEQWWQERKHWFFKPATGYGSKGSYSGAKVTKRVFGEIMHDGYVAQRMAAPGDRMVCLPGMEPQSLKYDVRCYVYDGRVQLVAARLYQGQTTNFRTPGGGFAPVRVVE